jgi:adenine-specific DNA-methyltransferase
MARTPKPTAGAKPVEVFTHDAKRRNIPTAELQSLAQQAEEREPVGPVHYARARPLPAGTRRQRDEDRDPQVVWNGVRLKLSPGQVRQLQETGEVELGDAQLTWRGKDTQDWSDLVVQPPPIYVQEKVHPKAIIADLQRQAAIRRAAASDAGPDLFADFNGLPDPEARLEFYQHDQHWSNRMVLGDSLQVMASLAEREGLRGKVQCVYFDPPYGIKFNSNWQVSTQSRDVKDGKREDLSREPEQVKAFRDTWKDGIHSYLTYLRDRLIVARELLTESGSIFVQIGDQNVHRVRSLLDEVFGPEESCGMIQVQKTSGAGSPSLGTDVLAAVVDYVLWYSKNKKSVKYRQVYKAKTLGEDGTSQYINIRNRNSFSDSRLSSEFDKTGDQESVFASDNLTSSSGTEKTIFPVEIEGKKFFPGSGVWKTNAIGMRRLFSASRLKPIGNTLMYRRYLQDFRVSPINNVWRDVLFTGFSENKVYVVQTAERLIARCVLMATDPGDIVLDPTCGSGTTASVAEQWGRRWIVIDTSRVALALARTRLMSARYPYYLLADSQEGRAKEAQLTGKPAPDAPFRRDLRQGFVYERAPHITLKSIANNAEIDVLWDTALPKLEQLRTALNVALCQNWDEWQVPRNPEAAWPEAARRLHADWWTARIVRQAAIDASIAKRADVELLYDRPYEDKSRVRVAGPFTVESLSPHRVIPADEDELAPNLDAVGGTRRRAQTPPVDFATMVMENLRTAGVHQSQKADSIHFSTLTGWPGNYIAAEGRFMEGEQERRAGILIGPEFGTLSRPDLVAAAREASDARFDVLIACAFNYDAHASELTKLGPLPILKARMNPDLHMADDLKNTGKGNLFVVFGEPDVEVQDAGGGMVRVKVLGVDVFDPQTGDIRSGGTDSIAAWFIDTLYDEESFRVRHAYFLGAQDPYKSLKTALRAEIDEEAWATLYRDTSRPFLRPDTGRIAVKVINHFGDEVMKVFAV